MIVRAIVTCQNHILLTKATKSNTEFSSENYFLPGGHVDHNEPAIEVLKRELKEETNHEASSIKFVGALECSWRRDSQTYHELNLVYLADMPTLTLEVPPISNEPFQEFVWYPLSTLSQCKMLPKQLINIIQEADNKAGVSFFSEMKEDAHHNKHA